MLTSNDLFYRSLSFQVYTKIVQVLFWVLQFSGRLQELTLYLLHRRPWH